MTSSEYDVTVFVVNARVCKQVLSIKYLINEYSPLLKFTSAIEVHEPLCQSKQVCGFTVKDWT